MSEDKNADSTSDDSFELDLDQDSGDSIESVFEEAVAAVDRVEKEHEGEHEAGQPTKAQAKRIAELEDEALGLRERLARNLADFDNFRKRSDREKESIQRYALFNPLRDFLEVVDNLNRALEAQGSAEDLKLGLQMTVRQLESLLDRYSVKKVEAVGRAFDPKVHEAVSREESAEVSEPMNLKAFASASQLFTTMSAESISRMESR